MTDCYQTNYPWLTKSLFECILRRNQEHDNICVIDMHVKSALENGENYYSNMLRVKVDYTHDKSSASSSTMGFVVKAPVTKADVGATVMEMGLFQREIENFEHVLPAVHSLLRSIGDETVLAPQCYAHSVNESYLVFEDLTIKGYSNINRKLGMRPEDYLLVLKKTAKFHAATAVIYEKDPHFFATFLAEKDEKTHKSWRTLVEKTSATVADVCKELPRFQHLSGIIEAHHDTVYDRFCDAVQLDEDGFNVLTHGDLWSNNVMFTKDRTSGVHTDAIIVDFQLSQFGSPVLDLIYTLFSSSHKEIAESDWDDLVQFYHRELVDCLLKLGYSRRTPTLTDLHVDMLRKGIYGSFFAIFMVAIRHIEVVVGEDAARFLGDQDEHREYRKQMLLQPGCRNEIEFLLSLCDRRGFFDK